MQAQIRIERALSQALKSAEARGAPPRLASAIRHAVVPGGARIRPQLLLAVACACGDDDPSLADGAAAALELLHCASLVHDDLPCFDDAPLRRGRASVHAAYGERCAVLAGDALIVMAFEALARAATRSPWRLPALLCMLASRVGMPHGIVAGQAWECEDWVALPDYQRAHLGGGGRRSGQLAQLWRMPGRGLPGGRRYSRCGGR
jgi:geranylgeranyl diphosphate synthase type II